MSHTMFPPGDRALPVRAELYVIEGDTMMVGGTHLSTRIMDFRTGENEPFFADLVAGLGRAYVEEVA